VLSAKTFCTFLSQLRRGAESRAVDHGGSLSQAGLPTGSAGVARRDSTDLRAVTRERGWAEKPVPLQRGIGEATTPS